MFRFRVRHPTRGISSFPGFTLVELLVVIAIMSLLMGIVAPALSASRGRAQAVRCVSNLRSVGQAMLSYTDAHDSYTQPAIAERDYYWDRGEQVGWDITTGRWAQIPGGPGTAWNCPAQTLPYRGNVRALGLDTRLTDGFLGESESGRVYPAGPRLWHQPARLIIVYDIPPYMIPGWYPDGIHPMAGDLTDELNTWWPRDKPEVIIWFPWGPRGPHTRGDFGVLFGDGHAGGGTFADPAQAVIWSGPRWWP